MAAPVVLSPECRAKDGRAGRLYDLLPLPLLFLLLLAGQRAFTVQEDEALIAQQSLRGVREILAPFLSGVGYHAHPPLSDLILSLWLAVTGGSLAWLRVLDIVVYVAGVAVLGLAAARLGGPRARTALYWIALLWPFGFHYAWLFGWFSFGFFFVALVAWSYGRVLELPTRGRWLLLIGAGAALLWTNYYGWAVLGLLGLDYLMAGPGAIQQRIISLTGALLLLGLAFLPLLQPLLSTVAERTDVDWAYTARVMYSGWLAYAFFASEAIAPWAFALSLPAALATFGLLSLLLVQGVPVARRLLAGFVILLFVMSVLGVAGSKRVFFLGPWVLLAVAVFIANARGMVRRGALVCLGILAALGWFGTVSRRYYGALRFFDPWPQVVEATASKLEQGATVVSYHPSYFFYLTYQLQVPENVRPWRLSGFLPRTVQVPRVHDPVQFLQAGRPPNGRFIFIKSAGFADRQQEAKPLEDALEARCRLTSSTGYRPDTHSDFKRRFAEDRGHLPFRIQVREYACPTDGTGSR